MFSVGMKNLPAVVHINMLVHVVVEQPFGDKYVECIL